MQVYEQLVGHCVGGFVQPASRPVTWQVPLPSDCVSRVGFEAHEAMLPYDARSFQGYRLLHEYLAFPQRLMFVRVSGLAEAFRRCPGKQLDLILLMNSAEQGLDRLVDAENFKLYCAPVINLFPKRADRIHLTDRFSEFHVVPDRTRPLDFEVYQVLGVTGHGAQAGEEMEFRSFYSAKDFDAQTGAYYVVHREPRRLSERERRAGRRSGYSGSEVYLSLVDAHAAPYRSDLRQLSVTTLCTNRDLPLHLPVGYGQTDFNLESAAPVETVRCLARPTHPRMAPVEGELAWRAISHLTLNYLSLIDTDEQAGASALRDLMRVYADLSGAETRKQIDGLKSIASRPVIRRVPAPGPVAFGRGVEIAVTLDDLAFEGRGAFLLGAVLERFLAKYVTTNSFTETVVRTAQRGEIMRWKPTIGKRQIL